jgi:hypothetical protein
MFMTKPVIHEMAFIFVAAGGTFEEVAFFSRLAFFGEPRFEATHGMVGGMLEGRLEVFAADMLLRCSSLFRFARFNLASLSQYCETFSVLPSVAYQ